MSIKYLGFTENGSQYPTDSELDARLRLNGLEFTHEQRIIAALVQRLGGNVTLALSELADVDGLCIVNGGPTDSIDLIAATRERLDDAAELLESAIESHYP